MTTHPLADVNGSYERLTADELGNLGIVLGAYRSFRGDRRKHIAYVGMPITSGKRYFDVLCANGVKTTDELIAKLGKDALYELVIKPNIVEGIALADTLGAGKDLLFIAPSVFEAKKWRWSQDAYMSLWYRVIGEMAGAHYVMDGWEYSTGGAKEVTFSMLMQWRYIRHFNLDQAARLFQVQNIFPDMSSDDRRKELEGMWGIRVYDQRGKELRIDDILDMLLTAIIDLHGKGLPYQDLLGPALTLKALPILSPLGPRGFHGVPPVTDRFWKAHEAVEKMAEKT